MASAFKLMVERDIRDVFINTLEFADEFQINGVLLPCVLDYNEENDRKARSFSEYPEGVCEHTQSLFVKVSEIGYKPIIGTQIVIRGEYYIVQWVDEQMGVYEIKISQANV